jgi:hypothetical protein
MRKKSTHNKNKRGQIFLYIDRRGLCAMILFEKKVKTIKWRNDKRYTVHRYRLSCEETSYGHATANHRVFSFHDLPSFRIL